MSLCLVTMRRPRRQMCEHTRSTIVQLFNKFWDFSDCRRFLDCLLWLSSSLEVSHCPQQAWFYALSSSSEVLWFPLVALGRQLCWRNVCATSALRAMLLPKPKYFPKFTWAELQGKKNIRGFVDRPQASKLKLHQSPDPNFRLTFCHHCIPCRSYWKCLAHQLKTRICHTGANWKMSELKVAR